MDHAMAPMVQQTSAAPSRMICYSRSSSASAAHVLPCAHASSPAGGATSGPGSPRWPSPSTMFHSARSRLLSTVPLVPHKHPLASRHPPTLELTHARRHAHLLECLLAPSSRRKARASGAALHPLTEPARPLSGREPPPLGLRHLHRPAHGVPPLSPTTIWCRVPLAEETLPLRLPRRPRHFDSTLPVPALAHGKHHRFGRHGTCCREQ